MCYLRLLRWLVVLVSLVWAIQTAYAQDDPNLDLGLKPYDQYNGGNIDHINAANGALGVDIPLISYPQKGGKLKLEFELHYVNSGDSEAEYYFDGYGYVYVATAGYLQHGFQFVLGSSIPSGVQLNEDEIADYEYGSTWTAPFTITMSDGAVHQMAPFSSGSQWESVDASGFHFVCTFDGSCPGPITDPDGIQYNINTGGGTPNTIIGGGLAYALMEYSPPTDPGLFQFLDGGTPSSIQDTNGNTITAFPPALYSSNATYWTDSLGRTIPAYADTSTSNCPTTPHTPTSAISWNPPGVNGGTYPILFCFIQVSETDPMVGTPYNTSNLQSVVLPNGTVWTFQYTNDSNNDLQQITFPTGGTLSYTWTTYTGINPSDSLICYDDLYWNENEYFLRAVHTRTLNPNDGVTSPGTWTYTIPSTTANPTVVTDPLGNYVNHKFTILSNSCSPYETQAQYYQSGGTLLKTISTAYSWSPGSADIWGPVALNVVPTSVTTAWPNGQQSEITYTYDANATLYLPVFPGGGGAVEGSSMTSTYGRLLSKYEYDYGSGAPGSLLRTTSTTYQAFYYSGYLSSNLLNLPYSVSVSGSGPGSYAYYGYDESGSPSGTHGNQTSVHRWLNTAGTYLNTSNVYSSAGLLTSSTDPNGNPTTYGYSACTTGSDPPYAGSGPTSVTNALSQTTAYCYDFNTGMLAWTTDPNGQTTSYTYDDMLRTTQITYPDTGQTNLCYTDSSSCSESGSYAVVITDKMATSQNKIAAIQVDGLGREIRRNATNGETSPYDQVDTCYDTLGRVGYKSYPYQSTGLAATRSCSGAGDSFTYDGLSRTTAVTHSDSTSISNSYTGRATQVSDEGNGTQNVKRISQVDGLGHLAGLCEVSSSLTVGISGSTTASACNLDISGTGFLTTYAYDALDDLTSVTQGPLNSRTFVYDSLARLTSSSNPESGTVSYTYDAAGNLATKVAPQANQTGSATTTTTYCYDAGNRLKGKRYASATCPLSAPDVSYNYEETSSHGVSLTNTVGRMSSESTAGTNLTGSVFSYDPMGRVLNNSQCTPQNCSSTAFPVSYAYDLLGDATSSTNGMSVTLSNTYNVGARLTQTTSSLSDANHPGTLFSSVHYNAAGAVVSAALGNSGSSISETRTYDGRLRLTGITDGSVYSLSVPTGGYAPDSDVLAANDSVNGNWTYSYDAFSRLIGSNQNSGTNVYSYGYDRFGNRWSQTVTAGSGFTSSLGFDANNHITSGSGVSYDAAGNVTNDGSHGYTYDPEGRISSVDSGSTASYVYDAGGRRVRKTTSAGSVDYLYDLAGHEIAEVSSTGGWNRGEVYEGGRHLGTYSGGMSGTTYFDFADWLGTERARSLPAASSACETVTSLPFGDGQTITSSCSDPSPMHFTGKERDSESGLDNFGARYDSSQYGRFMSPDPVFISAARLLDPQSLNLYSYVRNNPLSLTDPTGLDFYLSCQHSDDNSDTCQQVQNGSQKDWVQGQTVNGSFQATDVDMNNQGDTSAGYHDQFGNQYTGTFDQSNGVSFTNTGTGVTSGQSQFIDGSDRTQLNGSGAFANIMGNFFSDCGGSCQGRASLTGTPEAFAATESQLNKQSAFMSALDRLSGAHNAGSQWKDSNGYVHMLNSSGQMEMHFEGHPTGVDVQQFVLHMVDTIRDSVSGRAAAERNAPLP